MKRLHCHVEFTDGREIDIDTTTRDYVNYENTARKHKWGPMGDNPAIWEAFAAWSALKRTGQFDGTWEAFLDAAVNVEGTPFDVDPSRSAVGDG